MMFYPCLSPVADHIFMQQEPVSCCGNKKDNICGDSIFKTIKMKCMKKVMLLMGLMAFVFFTHAAEKFAISGERIVPGERVYKKGLPQPDLGDIIQFSCSVTQTASVSIYFVNYEISCTSTAATCREASLESTACAKEGIARLREIIK
jgi:hypothetical protein